MTQDSGSSVLSSDQGLEDAYNFMHEGVPMVYSDGFNHNYSGPSYFPNVSAMPISSGEYGDNSIPEICSLHNQLARGGTSSRWSDQNIIAFERYDYREGNGSREPAGAGRGVAGTSTRRTGNPADVAFDDGVTPDGDTAVTWRQPSHRTELATTDVSVPNSRASMLRRGFCARLGAGTGSQPRPCPGREPGLSKIAASMPPPQI